MKLKSIFLCGASLVIPIPKEYAAALKMCRGTQCIVRVQDRRLLVERALITGAGGPPADASTPEDPHV